MKKSASRPCWICGDPADTDEHRRKRSDLVARYGPNWTPKHQPFVIRGDGSSRWTRIQGPNDRKNLYELMLCGPCNSARTKPFDQAYQQFSDWVLGSAAQDFCGHLPLCSCKACQVGPDHEGMKGPDHVEIGEAEGIVGVHDGCRDELRAGWRIATEQR